MVGRVEEMGKEAFLVFREPEGFGEGGQRHLEETQRVFEHNVSAIDGQGQDLGAIDDLFWLNVLSVQCIQDEVRIEPLGIVGQDREFGFVGQCPQPIEKVFDARGAFKTKEFVAVGRGGAHQVGHVNPGVLHGFAVPIDEEFLFLR